VLAAGLGLRMRPLTRVRAKPAIPVAGEPMIGRIIRWLASHAIADVVVNLHHLPQTVAAVLGDGSDLAVRVRYSWEPRLLGTAGGPRQALDIVGCDSFAVVNGDTLTDLDLAAVEAAHAASDALVTMAVVPNRLPERYGGVRLDQDGVVTGFVPRGPAAAGSFHFIGVQMVRAAAFMSLHPGEPADSVGGLYDLLIRSRPGSIRGFVCGARSWDIGTPLDYLSTSLALSSNQAPPGSEARPGRRPDARAAGRRPALVRDSILWDDVTLGDGCSLSSCIVTDGVRVPDGARYAHAMLLRAEGNEPAVFPLTER